MNNLTAKGKMLIQFYNMQTGKSIKCGSLDNPDSNICHAISALERRNEDAAYIQSAIKEQVAQGNPGFKNIMISIQAEPTTANAEVTDSQIQNSMGVLEQAMVQILAGMNSSAIENAVVGKAEQKIKDFIKAEYGTIERKVITVIDNKPTEVGGVTHEKFETVLKFVANNEPVFLTGPAGSGKNELCKQVAKALGLRFYFTNAVTQEYKLTGFTDAMGNYQETQFYKAFTEGGLFMLDEMDASIPEVLVILNAAIANRYFDFPAPIGYKEAHPDFRVIAAGNTLGHGADFEYVGRNQLDGASLDRFAVVKIDYSSAIEEAMACGNSELLQFCREYREAANEQGLNVIVSYRAIKRLAKMVQLLSIEEALETCLVRGLEKDDVKIIANKISNGKYKNAMLRLAA